MEQPTTARQRARAELTREIKSLALDQLAETGADLSLRRIARELGLVSSALYRYFRSRDELLTALIVDAYDDLADALDAAASGHPEEADRDRWVAVCTVMRDWARAQPHRFALIYGSPVPGYRAPADTVAPAERVMTALTGPVQAAAATGRLWGLDGLDHQMGVADPGLSAQLADVATLLGPDVPAPVLARLVGAFGQVVGMVNLELGGHFVGGFEPADALFHHTVRTLAADLGLERRGEAFLLD
jgi:AcrR family transcriptional regulator